jgi:hypothetical protein
MNPLNVTQTPFPASTLAFGTTASPYQYLTPDALISYCQSRLQGIDTQVDTAFAQQQAANGTQTMLAALAANSALAVPSQPLDLSFKAGPPITYNTPADVAKVQGAYDAITTDLKTLSPGDPSYAALSNIANQLGSYDTNGNFEPNTNLGTSMPVDAWNSTVTTAVSDVSSTLNSDTQLSMINLQSLMDQRQQAIQICTNLVQSMGDSTSQVTANVGK